MSQLPDVQNHKDVRDIKLQKVGVANLYYPFVIRDKVNETQSVTARFDNTLRTWQIATKK